MDEATSLYEFTRVINDHYSAEQKLKLIGAMWAVAYADGDLDKYEEALNSTGSRAHLRAAPGLYQQQTGRKTLN